MNRIGPFRITVRKLPASATHLTQASAYIESWRDRERVSRKTFERIATHPDERVPIAFAELHGRDVRFSDDNRRGSLPDEPKTPACLTLYREGVRTARAENVLWTPVLDTLARLDVWPNEREAALLEDIECISRADVLDASTIWARTHATPADVSMLLKTFRWMPLLASVVRHMKDVTPEWIQAHGCHPAVLPALASRPDLDEGQLAAVWQVAIQIPGDKSGFSEAYGDLTGRHDLTWHDGDEIVRDVFVRLNALYPAIPESIIGELVDRTISFIAPKSGQNPGATEKFAAKLLIEPTFEFEIPHAAQDYLFRQLSRYSSVVNALARREDAPEKMLVDMANMSLQRIYGMSSLVPLTLARNPTARRIPEVRKTLLLLGHDNLLVPLIEDSVGEEFRTHFQRILRSNPPAAAMILRNGHPSLAFLDDEDLMPLITSDHRENREAAVTALSQIQDLSSDSQPQEPTRQGRGR